MFERRRVLKNAVVALAATGLSVGIYGIGSAAASRATTPRCATAGLVIWWSQASSFAGHSVSHVEFTNLSGHTCRLYGFPGVSAVNLANRQVGLSASRVGSRSAVTLPNGWTAHATLTITDNGALPTCHRVTAAGVRVYPPNETASKVVPVPFGACSDTKTRYMTVRAVAAGG